MQTTEGVWLPITDYSSYKKVSISTIRRHIKSNILKYKEQEGKYFIYVAQSERIKLKEEEEILKLRLENELLKNLNSQLSEENIGLKMLVEVYENKHIGQLEIIEPPELPIEL